MKTYQLLLVGIFAIFLTNFISAGQVCETYDDFSSGSLDLNKWTEINPTMSEYSVQNNVYHTAQLNSADRQVTLENKKLFLPGDVVEYDVNYVSGGGNRIHQFKIDNNPYSLFGFWNSVGDGGVGNDFGVYHVKITFTENGVSDEITLPNGNVVMTRPDGKLPSPGLEHTFGIITRTGHNGVVSMDYDNFIICSEQEEQPQKTLEERIDELEEKVEELENQVSTLESLFDKIEKFIKRLPRGLKRSWA